jgi:membrane-associated phospholipid phosphatase
MVGNPRREKKFYLAFSLLFYLAWFITFASVGKYAEALPTRDLTSRLDSWIPLVPAFVWPYELCYVFPFIPLLVLRDWHRFNRGILAIILANLSAFAVYFTLPVAFPRPPLGSSLSEAVLGLEYACDFFPGANKLPSLHVAFAWIVYLVCRGQTKKKCQDGAIFGLASLITLSTVFVKQHIVIDAAAGTLWGFGAWWLSRFFYPRWNIAGETPPQALKKMLKKILPLAVLCLAVLFLAADLHYERLIRW